MPVIDFHTHRSTAEGIRSVDLAREPLADLPSLCSIGIHPWSTDLPADDRGGRGRILNDLKRCAACSNVVAIGEAGLDNRHGAPVSEQTVVLSEQIAVSEFVAKPLILHIVGCWNEIIALHRKLRPTQPWIIHGFRGKPQLAEQLLREGFYLSFGSHFNPETVRITPSDRLLAETDDDQSVSIDDVIERLAAVRSEDVTTLRQIISANISRCTSQNSQVSRSS